jgi:hypothetical protein
MRREYVEHWGFSLGTTLGVSDLWGDVGTKSLVDHYNNSNYKATPMGGLFVRYTVHPALSMKVSANFGQLYASDDYNKDLAKKADIASDAYQRYLRNLNVRTNIWEGSFMFELTPLRTGGLNSRTARMRFQPYIQFGIAAFHFNPQGEYMPRDGGYKRWIDLYDLHLEGDGFGVDGAPAKYSKWQAAIPLSFGVRWDIGTQLALGLECTYRYTFTDYLDNVSDVYIDPTLFDQYNPQYAATAKDMYDKSWWIDPNYKHTPGDLRGNKAVNDGYSSVAITFFYKIKSRYKPWWWYFREY